jgi:predicted alpha/beta superfamily hydrolase
MPKAPQPTRSPGYRRMSPSLVACVLSLCVAQGDDPHPPAKKAEVPVVFRVTVPATTPKGAKIYLAGSLAALGEWKSDGKPLKLTDDGRYAGVVLLSPGASLEYKVTMGTWALVEKDAKGGERPNRNLRVDRKDMINVDLEVESWPAANPAPQPPRKKTITGTVQVHDKFASEILGNSRNVLVWLPPGYADEPSRRYPVLYLQDGQNVFDEQTSAFGSEWKADETADRLIGSQKIPPILIVAIANTPDRINEYTPVADDTHKSGGGGLKYERFLIEELKPFIDKIYRTKPERESTAIGGSSLGGLLAMETTLDHPEVFSRCAALSPSIWWGNDRLLADVKAHAPAARRGKFWIDMGTKEDAPKDGSSPSVERAKKLGKALNDAGLVAEQDYHLEIIEGGKHQEADWAGRFERVLVYLFGL